MERFFNNFIEKAQIGTNDSDKHFITLFSITLASGAKNIIELGVREGGTTLPLLIAAHMNRGTLYSVDINKTPFIPPPELKNSWKFTQQDAIQFLENWDTSLDVGIIYIDDWHSYSHVKKELELIDRIVSPSSIILIHDLMYGGTSPFYHTDLTNSAGEQWADGGPYRAVAELNPQFWEFATLPWSNGLTVLRKKYSNKFKQR
jgi:predicted O-methyltransferase YrrM